MDKTIEWLSDNYEKVFAALITAIMKIYVSNITGYVLLWLLLIILYVSLKKTEKKYEKIQASFEATFEARLQECVKKHVESDDHIDHLEERLKTTETRLANIKNKYTVVIGMMAASMGRRQLPPDFWQIVLDENTNTIPHFLIEDDSHKGG